MVQAMDHEAVEGDIWIRKLKERWMVQAMEGAMDDSSDGSRSSRRRYMDQEAVEGAMDGTCYGSGSSRTNVQAMSRRRY